MQRFVFITMMLGLTFGMIVLASILNGTKMSQATAVVPPVPIGYVQLDDAAIVLRDDRVVFDTGDSKMVSAKMIGNTVLRCRSNFGGILYVRFSRPNSSIVPIAFENLI